MDHVCADDLVMGFVALGKKPYSERPLRAAVR
jgi:hypothetical protein